MTIENLEIKKFIVRNIIFIYNKINRFIKNDTRYNIIDDIKDMIDYPYKMDPDDEEYELLKNQVHLYHEILINYLSHLGIDFTITFSGISSINMTKHISNTDLITYLDSEFHIISYMIDSESNEIPEDRYLKYLPIPIYNEIQNILFEKNIFNRKPFLDSYIVNNIKSLVTIKFSRYIYIYFSLKDMINHLTPCFDLDAFMYQKDSGKKVGQTKLHLDTIGLQPNSVYSSFTNSSFEVIYDEKYQNLTESVNKLKTLVFLEYNYFIKNNVMNTIISKIKKESLLSSAIISIDYTEGKIFIDVQDTLIIDESEDKETRN